MGNTKERIGIMKKSISMAIALIVSLSCVGCGSKAEIEALRKENRELRQKLAALNTQTPQASPVIEKYAAHWVDDGTPFTYSTDTKFVEIKQPLNIVQLSDKYILTMDFHYQNKADYSMNFINDSYVYVQTFQNGVELSHPGNVSIKGLYDTSGAYVSVKNGGEVDAQLAFILQDLNSPVEVDIGYHSDPSQQINKSIAISKK